MSQTKGAPPKMVTMIRADLTKQTYPQAGMVGLFSFDLNSYSYRQ